MSFSDLIRLGWPALAVRFAKPRPGVPAGSGVLPRVDIASYGPDIAGISERERRDLGISEAPASREKVVQKLLENGHWRGF